MKTGTGVQKAVRQHQQKEHPCQLAYHDSSVRACIATFQLQDVTDSFPPEMGKDVLVQSSFRVAASRVGTWLAHEPFHINRVNSKMSKQVLFDVNDSVARKCFIYTTCDQARSAA